MRLSLKKYLGQHVSSVPYSPYAMRDSAGRSMVPPGLLRDVA